MNLFKIQELEDYCVKADCHTNPKTLKIVEGTERLVAGQPRFRIRAVTFPLTFMIQWQAEGLTKEKFDSHVGILVDHGHMKGRLEDLSTGRL
jgi:hypothetical protein